MRPPAPTPRLALGAAALALAGGLAAACGSAGMSSTGASDHAGQRQIAGKTASFHGQADVRGRASVSMELDDDYFQPTLLVGSPGQQLAIDLKNEGRMPHTFTIPGGVDKTLDPGSTATVRVTFPRSGTTGFVCRFHEALGMVGGLQVG